MKRLGQGPIEADVRALRVLLGKCGLAQPAGWLPFTPYQTMPFGIGGAAYPFMVSLSRNMKIRTWDQLYYVQTTNNGSNYWNISLEVFRAGVLAVSSFTTAADPPNAFRMFSDKSIDYDVSLASYFAARIYVTPTGSPGGLYLGGPAVFVT